MTPPRVHFALRVIALPWVVDVVVKAACAESMPPILTDPAPSGIFAAKWMLAKCMQAKYMRALAGGTRLMP